MYHVVMQKIYIMALHQANKNKKSAEITGIGFVTV